MSSSTYDLRPQSSHRSRLYFEADFQGDANAPAFEGAINTASLDLFSAEVHLITSRRPHDPSALLLARLRGLYITTRLDTGYVPTWRLRVAHVSARDDEHDPVYLCDLNVVAPVVEDIYPASIRVLATINALAAYPLGTDPLATSLIKACNYCQRPHAIGPFIPPERPELCALVGSLIRITLLPLTDL